MKKLFAIVSLLCCLLTTPMYAAGSSTEGTEFWLTFMSNLKWQASDNALQLKLIVSSRYTTSVTVSNPNTSWSTTVNVPANGISEINVPVAQAYTTLVEKAAQTGLKVVAAKPISLYASNYADASYDATNVLPLASLTGNYIIQTYESNLFYEDIHYAKEFIVVATDNCTVEITPHARTTTGRLRNSTFSVTLKKGEVYQVQSTDENNDLSGTIVRASRPVAVFAGHQCATVPSDNEWCDHIVEQAMPVSQWGKQFPVTASMIQQTNRVLITAVSDNTEVSLNGSVVATLAALETYEFPLTASQQSCFVETSAPSACYLYLEGGMTNSRWGDPSSVYISPVEQMIQLMTFSTFQTPRSQYHYVNIVTTQNGKESIRLDGQAVRALFTPLEGNPDLVFARIKVEHGTHTIQTDLDGFTAWVYGMGDGESYAYTAGSATNALDAQILVDGQSGIQAEMTEFCHNHNFTFTPQVNIPYSTVAWDYGDGTGKGYGSKVTHQYAKAGDYTVSMTVSNDSEKQTVTTLLHLVSVRKDTVFATICDGDKYIFNDNEYTESGTYPVTGLHTVDGCDSIAVLKLNVNDSFFFEEEKSIAKGQTLRWHGKRYTAGEYYDSLLTVHGCDSVYKLTLKEVDPPQKQYDTICYEPTYTFHGHEYPIPPVDKYKDQEFVDYVLEYRDNEACLTYKLYLAIVPTAEEHKEFDVTVEAGQSYDFHGQKLTVTGDYIYEEPLGCHGTYSETLHLFVKPYPVIETAQVLCRKDDSFDFYGKTLTEAGVYFDTVYSVSGISELRKLTLTDNRSYTVLNITTDDPSYTLLGKTYTQSGSYTVVTDNAAGCDSIITLNLGIGGKCKVEYEWNDYICKNSTYTWNTATYTTPGDYEQTFETAAHCDSVVTLHLKQAEPAATLISAAICEGDYYKWNGQKYDKEDVYKQTFTTVHGCDSVVTLTLSVKKAYNTTIDTAIVLGNTFKWDGDEYTQDSTITKNYIAANGCDSVVTVNLSVITTIYSRFEEKICKGSYFEWNEEKLTEPKDYYHTYIRPGKADSVVTLHLIVHPSYDMPAEKVTVKELQLPYMWQGRELYESGPYEETLHTETYGCDSVVHLSLTVLPTIRKTIDTTICFGDYYEWKGERLTVSTDDTDTRYGATPDINDTIVTLHLTVLPEVEQGEQKVYLFADNLPFTWNNQTFTDFGKYTVTGLKTDPYQCDSSAVLYLIETTKPIEKPIKDTALCAGETIDWYGQIYDQTGVYESKLHKGEKADTVYILNLLVHDPIPVKTLPDEHRCEGEGFLWLDGETYTTSQPLSFTTPSLVTGCDSTIQLQLYFHPSYDMPARDTTVKELQLPCKWQGRELYESGPYEETLHTETYGCDSVVHLSLTVLPTIRKTIDTTICFGDYYEWKGERLTVSTDDTDTRYGATPDINDTIVTLHLTVLPEVKIGEQKVYLFADNLPFTWNNQTFTDFGKYTVTGLKTDPYQCDSSAVLYLIETTKPIEKPIKDTALCAGETIDWYGQIYDHTGVYESKLHKGEDADTVYILNLIVHDPIPVKTLPDEHRCEGEGFLWLDGETYTASQPLSFTTPSLVTGCDSTIQLQLYFHPSYDMPARDTTVKELQLPCKWQGRELYESGPYAETLHTDTYGCDSVVHLSLTVLPTIRKTIDTTICFGDYYEWKGERLTVSTDDTDTRYGATPNINDTIVTLHLTVLPEVKIGEQKVYLFADNLPFTWNNQTFTDFGKYTVTGLKTDPYQCDSSAVLYLIETTKPIEKPIKDTALCAGETIDWYGQIYDQTGVYESELHKGEKADTVYILNLIVHDPIPVKTLPDEHRCEGEEYTWLDGKTYTASQPLSFTTPSLVTGCDSTIQLQLYFHPSYDMSARDTTVKELQLPCKWQGRELYESGPYAETLHTETYGCDSVVHLSLTVLPTIRKTIDTTICFGDYYEWKGTKLTVSTDDTDTRYGATPDINDTIVTLHLTVLPEIKTRTEEHTMYKNETYTWEGDTYTASGSYDIHYTTVHGCDSVVTLNLTVLDRPVLPRDSNVTICEGETFLFYGEPFTTSTEHTTLRVGTKADTLVTLRLTVLPKTRTLHKDTVLAGKTYALGDSLFTRPGDYTVTLHSVQGCDSVILLHLDTWAPQPASFVVEDRCADAGTWDIRFDAFGAATQVHLRFDAHAHAAGLRDTIISIPPDGLITLPITARAGKYKAQADLLFKGQVAQTLKVPIVFLYPSFVLEQHWNDVVAVLTHDYNGGYDFIGFQWYENGVKLVGENNSYLYRPLVMGAEYSAMLTEADGTRLMCCPIIAMPQTDVSVFPTVSEPARIIHCYVSCNARFTLYDAVGRLLQEDRLDPGDNPFLAPAVQGTYFVRIQTDTDKTKILKLFVQ